MAGAPKAAMFPTTRWTVLMRAGTTEVARAQALRQLADIYRPALFRYLQSKRIDSEAADDYVQDFLAHFVQGRGILQLDRAKGRLRVYLRVALDNHIRGLATAAGAQKRGGTTQPLSLEALASPLADVDTKSAEESYDQAVAAAMLRRALVQVAQHYQATGRGEQWKLVHQILLAPDETSYSELGCPHGLSVGALKSAVHRARERLRRALWQELSETVASAAHTREEWNILFPGMSPP